MDQRPTLYSRRCAGSGGWRQILSRCSSAFLQHRAGDRRGRKRSDMVRARAGWEGAIEAPMWWYLILLEQGVSQSSQCRGSLTTPSPNSSSKHGTSLHPLPAPRVHPWTRLHLRVSHRISHPQPRDGGGDGVLGLRRLALELELELDEEVVEEEELRLGQGLSDPSLSPSGQWTRLLDLPSDAAATNLHWPRSQSSCSTSSRSMRSASVILSVCVRQLQ